MGRASTGADAEGARRTWLVGAAIGFANPYLHRYPHLADALSASCSFLGSGSG